MRDIVALKLEPRPIAITGLQHKLYAACVTHSPVMRAILVHGLGISDPGEPGWVEEIVLEMSEGRVQFRFREHTGQLPG